MRVMVSLAGVFLVSATSYGGEFEDCVLNGMKGVSSDAAARVVNQACRSKVIEAKKAKLEVFGSPLREGEFEHVTGDGSINSHDDGYYSQVFKNTSNYKTVTYVALEIRDGDYFDHKIRIPSDFYGEEAWRKERSQIYYYKLALKPKTQIRLMFRQPRTEKFYAEVVMTLGRESKWSDSMSTSAWSGTAKPEAKDPLE